MRVADHAQVVAVAEPRVEQQLLQRVHVLVLVHHEVPEQVVHLVGGGPVVEQDGGGQLEDGLEVDQVPLPPQLLVGGVDRGQAGRPGRGRAARGGRGGRVPVRADLGDLGPLDLAGRVGQGARAAVQADLGPLGRLADQAGLAVDQLRRAPADDPRPEVVELAQRGRVERGRPHQPDAQLAEPAAQLAGRPHGEGEGQHVRRVHRAGRGGVGDPVGDRPGLAGARAGQHADRAPAGQGHLALLRVEPGQQRLRGPGHRAGDVGHGLILPHQGEGRGGPAAGGGRVTPGDAGRGGTSAVLHETGPVKANSRRPRVSGQLTMYTTPWCGFCRNLKRQLARDGIEMVEVDIEQDEAAAEYVMSVNGGNQTVPTVVFPDGTALTNPSAAQVKAQLAAIAS